MTMYEALTLFVVTLTAGILVIQAGLALKTLRADHERRKKQATFEIVLQIRPVWMEAKHAIEEKWGREPLTSKELEEIDNDYKLSNAVKKLLALLEYLSVGMNSGLFDKDLLYRMTGTQLINIFHRLRTYIVRARKNNPMAYIEYQEIVLDFEDRTRIKPGMAGNIVHS